MSRHQQLLRVDFEEPFRTDAAALAVDVESLLAKVKVLVLSDYGKGRATEPPGADPGGAGAQHSGTGRSQGQGLRHLSRRQPDHPEPVRIRDHRRPLRRRSRTGRQGPGADERTRPRCLAGDPRRAWHDPARDGQPALHLPARAREVFDVTGAGDTVISTLAAALAAGESCRPRWAWPTWPPASWSASWVPRRSARPNCVARCSASRVPSVACWAWSNCCWQSKTPAPTARRSSSPMAASTSFTPAT